MGTFLLRRAVLGAEARAERVARGRPRAWAAVLDLAERAASRAAVGPAVSRVPVASAVPVG